MIVKLLLKGVCCEPASGMDNSLSGMLRVRRVLLSEGCNTPAYLETERRFMPPYGVPPLPDRYHSKAVHVPFKCHLRRYYKGC